MTSPANTSAAPRADPPTSAGLSRADRLQPLLLLGSVLAGLAIGTASGRLGSALAPLVSIGVVVLIYLVMLGLDIGGAAAAFRQRRFLMTAVALNFVVNPLVAWALSVLFLSGEPDLRVGLILFLVTPCIGWYLVFTELAGGDTGLGVGLLAVNIVLQVLLLPLYLLVFVGTAAGVELGGITASIGLYLVLPAVAAVASRAAQDRAGPLRPVLAVAADDGRVKTVMLAVVIIAMFASQADVLVDNPRVVAQLVPPLLVFFVVAFGLAVVAGRIAGLPYDQVALLVFTATSRNSEASLAVAATAFASPLVGLTVVLGPVVELPLLILMVRLLRSGRVVEAGVRIGV